MSIENKYIQIPALMLHMPHNAPLFVTMPLMQQRIIAPGHIKKSKTQRESEKKKKKQTPCENTTQDILRISIIKDKSRKDMENIGSTDLLETKPYIFNNRCELES